MSHEPRHELSNEMDQCIQNCTECHRVCISTLDHCLEMGGDHAAAAHIKLLQDCADVCHASATLMIRGSQFQAAHCAMCAQVCERCAEDCERFADDDVMQECAQVCRRCAESCARMAGSSATA
jgi:hypothetical protein